MSDVNICETCGKSFPARALKDKLCPACAEDALFQAQVINKMFADVMAHFPGSEVVTP